MRRIWRLPQLFTSWRSIPRMLMQPFPRSAMSPGYLRKRSGIVLRETCRNLFSKRKIWKVGSGLKEYIWKFFQSSLLLFDDRVAPCEDLKEQRTETIDTFHSSGKKTVLRTTAALLRGREFVRRGVYAGYQYSGRRMAWYWHAILKGEPLSYLGSCLELLRFRVFYTEGIGGNRLYYLIFQRSVGIIGISFSNSVHHFHPFDYFPERRVCAV